ncbi:hypothetical protein [Neisseria musculi]|nr:hypothetical protein [Neisseria musculi]
MLPLLLPAREYGKDGDDGVEAFQTASKCFIKGFGRLKMLKR